MDKYSWIMEYAFISAMRVGIALMTGETYYYSVITLLIMLLLLVLKRFLKNIEKISLMSYYVCSILDIVTSG